MDAFAKRTLAKEVPLNAEIRENLPKLTAHMRPHFPRLSDIVGEFEWPLAVPPPLVSSRVRALIEALAPGAIETVAPPRCWDWKRECDLDGQDHAFVNVVRCIDGWDKEKAEVYMAKRKDGSTRYTLGTRQIIDPDAVGDAHLWRDSRTGHILCSEEFKRQAMAMSVTNIYFMPTTT